MSYLIKSLKDRFSSSKVKPVVDEATLMAIVKEPLTTRFPVLGQETLDLYTLDGLRKPLATLQDIKQELAIVTTTVQTQPWKEHQKIISQLLKERLTEYDQLIKFFGEVREVIKSVDYAAGAYAPVDKQLAAFLSSHKYRTDTTGDQEAEVRGYLKTLHVIGKGLNDYATVTAKDYYTTLYRASKRLLDVAMTNLRFNKDQLIKKRESENERRSERIAQQQKWLPDARRMLGNDFPELMQFLERGGMLKYDQGMASSQEITNLVNQVKQLKLFIDKQDALYGHLYKLVKDVSQLT